MGPPGVSVPVTPFPVIERRVSEFSEGEGNANLSGRLITYDNLICRKIVLSLGQTRPLIGEDVTLRLQLSADSIILYVPQRSIRICLGLTVVRVHLARQIECLWSL